MERIHSVVAVKWAVEHCIEALPRPGNKIGLPDCNKNFVLEVIGIIGKLIVRASQCNKNKWFVAGRCRDMSRKPSGSAIWRHISPTSESASVLHVCRLFEKPWVRATGYNNNGGNVATGCRLMGSGQYCWSTFKAWPGELLAKMELLIAFGWMKLFRKAMSEYSKGQKQWANLDVWVRRNLWWNIALRHLHCLSQRMVHQITTTDWIWVFAGLFESSEWGLLGAKAMDGICILVANIWVVEHCTFAHSSPNQ